ncbi:MAG TPA: Rieske (2Fe-2S) protein [Flavobacteriales bacterium]|nr:Rieske (2Fe-2S) protein [Flavobacteriales bacterium]
MERRSFIRLCGMGTAAAVTGGLFLPGCAGIPHIQVTAVDGVLRLDKSVFAIEGKDTFRRSVIVEVSGSKAPIVVFRTSDHEHTALQLLCTHKSAELNVAGDQLTCPAHGSAFSNTGAVLEGPASDPLKRFAITYAGDDLLIALS